MSEAINPFKLLECPHYKQHAKSTDFKAKCCQFNTYSCVPNKMRYEKKKREARCEDIMCKAEKYEA